MPTDSGISVLDRSQTETKINSYRIRATVGWSSEGKTYCGNSTKKARAIATVTPQATQRGCLR